MLHTKIGAVGLAALLVATVLSGCGKKEAASKPQSSGPSDQRKPLPIEWEPAFQKSAGSLGIARYVVKLGLWHTAPQPVDGVIRIRAYGDVAGQGGKGNNADIVTWDRKPAGRDDATIGYYYLRFQDDPGEGTSADEVGAKSEIVITVRFEPKDPNDTWLETEWIFAYRNGEANQVSKAQQDPEFLAWLTTLGVDTNNLLSASITP